MEDRAQPPRACRGVDDNRIASRSANEHGAMVPAVERILLVCSGILGFLAVGLGAFGAHGLQKLVAGIDDGAQRLEWWRTAASYHLAHALAVAVAAWMAARGAGAAASSAGVFFTGGVLLFSGTLYGMALGGPRWLGAVTPLGGLLFLAGWCAVVVGALRLR